MTPAERSRASRLKRLYDITPEEYDRILEYQNGVCAICGNPPKATRLAVDHDHTTGLVRGLVDWKCNAAMAKFSDDADRMEAAARYIRTPPATAALGSPRFGRVGRVTSKSRKRKRK